MYAHTEVCAVDVENARLRRLDAVGIGEDIRVYRALADIEWQQINKADTLTVRTSNIDYAGHTNNIEYIRMLLNTFTLEEWGGGIVPRELQIAYVSQSFLNDELSIYATNHKDENISLNEHFYTIKKGEQDVLRCVMRW